MAAEEPLSGRHPSGALLGLALLLACAGPVTWGAPLRLSELEAHPDPVRRASTDWVLRGLGEEPRQPDLALSRYERAIQTDPTNPWAYLALARHYAAGDPDRALEHLDQAESLLESEGAISPRVEPHLLGIRGVALVERGEVAYGEQLIAEARAMAPSVWGDGRLSPAELR